MPWRKDPATPQQVYIAMNLSVLHQSTYEQYPGGYTLRKGECPMSQVLLDTGFKLTLIPKEPKLHHDLLVRVRAYKYHVVSRVLAKV